MKKIIIKLIFIFCLVAAALTVTACQSTYDRPADYVEVEKLSIDSANVFLSPSGTTSTYQLDVHILPENASNRKLLYYIPSEYMQYLRVTETGFLSATGQIPDNFVIPVKVSSTTNKNAYLTVNVKIEVVPVKEIAFDPYSVSLRVGETFATNPIFTPYHAQDGRSVTYYSLNEEVATVDPAGVVTAEKAGTAIIVCQSTTSSGKTVMGRTEIKVVYAPGRYRLEVSDVNPQYNQVLGDFRAIHFNLMSLDPNSDPDIRIQWFVDSKRVVELGLDARQYEHIPDVESRTSYRIKVVIDPSKDSPNDPQQILYSELITIYNRFQGFYLDYANLTSEMPASYRYGDTVTFELTAGQSSVTEYHWYLRKNADLGEGRLVAITPTADRNLTRRLNIEGDYVLTAKSMTATGFVGSKDFIFSVTRFVEGDSLSINPILNEYGTPPETYNYYLAECDENGEAVGSGVLIGHSSEGEVFNYTVNTAGNYILIVDATLNGKQATIPGVNADGRPAEVPFEYRSDVLRFYSSSVPDSARADDLTDGSDMKYRCEITNVVISAIADGENKLLLTWDAPLGIEDYTVEIKKGDEIFFFNGSGFGNRSFIVPTSAVTLNDTFSVRIKADGGLFSSPYHYNATPLTGFEEYYFDKIPAAAYPYLTPLNGTITRYARNMRALGDILRFISDYTPTNIDEVATGPISIDGVMYKLFTFDLMLGFKPDGKNYFFGELSEDIPSELAGIYKALMGAQNVYCSAGIYKYSVTELSDGGYSVTLRIPADSSVIPSTPERPSLTVAPSYSSSPYGDNRTYHAIDFRKSKNVGSGEQLFYAVATGYKPAFTSDSARFLYQKAINVINSVIGEEMTEREKLLAIFDYLTLNVVYDYELAEITESDDPRFFNNAGFALEGVFDSGKAVCDGISKAFVLLCAIEGIQAERVTGTIDGKPHAWNKVLLDGKYYVVDCTNGIIRADGTNVTDHGFFLISDEDFRAQFSETVEYGENHYCPVSENYYETRYASDAEELTAIIASFENLSSPTLVCVEFDPDEVTTEELTEISDSAEFFYLFPDGKRLAIIVR